MPDVVIYILRKYFTRYFCFCIVSFLSVKFNCSKFLQTLLIFICYDMILCNMVLVRIFRTAGAKRASNLLSTRRCIVAVQVNLCQKLLFLHPQYDDILFIELQVQYMKAQTWGEHSFWQRFTCNKILNPTTFNYIWVTGKHDQYLRILKT